MKQCYYLTVVCMLFSTALFSQNHKYFDESWRQDYGKAINGEIADVEIDGNNNVIVLGQHSAVGGDEIKLHCVHSNGTTLWANACSNSVGNNRAVDITLDNNNNIYALFTAETANGTEVTTSKFSMQGAVIWSQTEIFPSGSRATKVIKKGNKILSLVSKNTNGNMSIVVSSKNANNGNSLGSYAQSPTQDSYIPVDFLAQGNGSIVILSKKETGNGSYSHITRLNSNLNLNAQMTIESTTGNHSPNALAEYNNKILIAGKADVLGGKAVVYGLNSNCNSLLITYTSPFSSSEYGTMKVKNNKIHLVGTHVNFNGERQGLVQRASVSFNLQFNYEHHISQSYASSNIQATSIDVDDNGNAFALFTTKMASAQNNWLLISYDSNGTEERRYNFDQASETDHSQKVIANNTSTFLFGRSTDGQGDENATVVRLTAEDITDIPAHDNEDRTLYNTLVKNYGQVGSFGTVQASARGVNYFSYQAGYYDFIGDNSITFQPVKIADEPNQLYDVNRIDMSFIGGKLINQVPIEQGTLKRNYYLGHTERGVEGAEEYGAVLFGTLYEGIDMKYTHNSAGARMFFRVGATGDYATIKMQLSGVTATSIVSDELIMENPVSDLIFVEPVAYQIINGVSTFLPINYVTNGTGEVSFNVTGNVDKDKELYIYMGQGDNPPAIPKDVGDNMEWSTYFGENPITVGFDVAVDQLGNAHYTGKTNDVALLGSFGVLTNIPFAGGEDAYVVKFDENIVPQWYTYYGGGTAVDVDPANEVAVALAVDPLGNRVYITGETYSTDLPIVFSGTEYNEPTGNACSPGSANGCAEIFVARLDVNGLLQWSTYFGEGNGETCRDIELDPSNNVYIVGKRSPSTILTPLTGADNSTDGSALLLKFNDQNELEWANGFEADFMKAISADGNGNVVIVGNNTNNPMTTLNPPANPNTTVYNGGAADGFVARYNPSGVLTHSFYYGGNCQDELTDVGTDGDNNVYICGKTYENFVGSFCVGSTDLPVLGNGLSIPSGAQGTDQNHFIAKFDPMIPNTPAVLSHAGYFGGEFSEVGFNVDNGIRWTEVKMAVAKDGVVAMSGTTNSSSFWGDLIHMPTVQPSGFFIQADKDLHENFTEDAYVAVFNKNFEFKYSTYFGDGRDQDVAAGLAYSESDGRLYYSGNTDTPNADYTNPDEWLIMEEYDVSLGSNDYFFDYATTAQRPTWISFFDLDGLDIPSQVGVDELTTQNILLYPNPSENSVVVSFDGVIDNIVLYDISGRKVLEQKGGGNKSTSLNIASLQSGSYIVVVISGDKQLSTKLIKQ